MDIEEQLASGEPEGGEATPAITETTEPQTAEATGTTETETEAQKRERDERGRFKAKEQDQTMVPLTALHETRDKLRALETELSQMRQPPPQPQAPPDMFEDPEGYQRYQSQQMVTALYQERRNFSQRFAVEKYGEQTVSEACQWGFERCAADPAFNQALYHSPDPIGAVVQQYQREQSLSKLNADPAKIDEFLAWQAAQQAAPQQQQPAPIPTSLASQQSARGDATNYQPPSLEEILKG